MKFSLFARGYGSMDILKIACLDLDIPILRKQLRSAVFVRAL